MYAIIHNNKVFAGPNQWNRAFFTQKLKGVGVPVVLPKQPVQTPFVINEQTRIVEASVIKDDINPMVQYLLGPIWDLSADVAVAYYQATETPMPQARDNFRKILANERYRREVAGFTMTVQGTEVTVDTSRDGRHVFVQRLMLMADEQIVSWKFPEAWLNLSKVELGQIVAAGAHHIQTQFDWEKEVNELIDQASNAEELLALDIVPEAPGRAVRQ